MLATFNGERFLEAQIASIINQTYNDWTLLIRDDGSTDGTLGLVLQAAKTDSRIVVVSDHPGITKGVVDNFGCLLQHALGAGATVVFVCDQDDIWHPQKIECQLRHFSRCGLESEAILAHSDMELIGEKGQLLSKSFFAARGLAPQPVAPLEQLLSLNYISGCSLAINRRLLALALPIPHGAILHDWWLALVAASVGRICYDKRPLLAYRQHSHNVVGARGEWALLREVSRWSRGWRDGYVELETTFKQAEALLAKPEVANLLQGHAGIALGRYARLPTRSRMERIRDVRALKLRQGKVLLKLVIYLRLLTLSDGARRLPVK